MIGESDYCSGEHQSRSRNKNCSAGSWDPGAPLTGETDRNRSIGIEGTEQRIEYSEVTVRV